MGLVTSFARIPLRSVPRRRAINTTVIPGRAAGASPESITTALSRLYRTNTETVGVMDSGLLASLGPGMTGTQWPRRANGWLTGLALVALLLLPTGSIRAQSLAELAVYAGPDRTQRLINGAKK